MKRIQEFTTEELIDELLERHKPAIFIGTRIEENNSIGGWEKRKGDLDGVRGLLKEADSRLERELITDLLNQAINIIQSDE